MKHATRDQRGSPGREGSGHGSRGKALGESIGLRVMIRRDIPDGMRLKQAAGWNQSYEDWRRFLVLNPGGCFVATLHTKVVGTVTACLFGDVAWIGMMLVDPPHRRQGIANRLMQCVLAYVDAAGVARTRLDATAMGVPLYERFGFRPQLRIIRYGGLLTMRDVGPDGSTVRDFRWRDWRALHQLDCAVVQVDRTKLLKRLLLERSGHARLLWSGGRLQGFLLDRPGSCARQLGPFVARSEMVGRTLLFDARRRLPTCGVVMDIPADNLPARTTAEKGGLVAQREFVRMCRGAPCQESVAELWGGSGPEKG